MSKGTNRNLDARITLEQLLALYTDPESHNAQRHRQTDGRQTDGQTDAPQDDANSRSYGVAVRSAKNPFAVSPRIQLTITADLRPQIRSLHTSLHVHVTLFIFVIT